jgi:hypothetical protein
MIGGGMLAAHLYIKSSPAVVTLGGGALLGALTGAISGVAASLFQIPVQILMRRFFLEYLDEARRIFAEVPNMPSSVVDMLNASMSQDAVLLNALVSLPLHVILYGLITTLGAVLGVAVFEKRKSRGSDTPFPPAPLPRPPENFPPPPPPPPTPEP